MMSGISNYIEWDILESPFGCGANDSKIIMTTRCEKKLKNMMRNVQKKIVDCYLQNMPLLSM